MPPELPSPLRSDFGSRLDPIAAGSISLVVLAL